MTSGTEEGHFDKHRGPLSGEPGDEKFWRAHYENEQDRGSELDYEDYAPAYRLGYENRVRLGAESFELVEDQLETQWSDVKGNSRLDWPAARAAIRAAWKHIER